MDDNLSKDLMDLINEVSPSEQESFEYSDDFQDTTNHIYNTILRLSEYAELREKGEYPDNELFTDSEAYVCFYDRSGFEGPGLIWTLHHDGWVALVSNVSYAHLYCTGWYTFPTDDERGEAAKAYEKWMKREHNLPELPKHRTDNKIPDYNESLSTLEHQEREKRKQSG